MLKRMRPRITFSNVVALLALFFALGGTVYAASKINGKQIKSGSIPGNRIKKNSLTGNQINEGTLKSTITYVSAPVSLDATLTTPFTATATCPGGQKATGGGATVNNPNTGDFVNDMTFTNGGIAYTARFYSGSVNSTGTVTVACVPAA